MKAYILYIINLVVLALSIVNKANGIQPIDNNIAAEVKTLIMQEPDITRSNQIKYYNQ